ncbi:MAG: sigma-54 dependent transcriptional regulator [Syntrophomonadaceae bacterium]|nr:sigma-54 dependent transcriptional regulator [Syntrophomonadaceae bacterium]
MVDDEDDSRSYMAEFLTMLGHTVAEESNGLDAIKRLETGIFHLIISDIRMPGMSGIELLSKVHQSPEFKDVIVVLATAYSDMKTAIEALRAGAYDYLLKPVNIEELVSLIERIAQHQSLKWENQILTTKFEAAVEAATAETVQELTLLKQAYYQQIGMDQVVVYSQTMQDVFQQAQKLHTDRHIPVLIEGETGTGKEIVARCIHYGDSSNTDPFIDINCATLATNIFESELFGYEAGAFTGGLPKGQRGKIDIARGGTLFLDEITEMPLDVQAKLLRVIQEKEFYRVGGLKKFKTDVRIICASNEDIEKKIDEGTFRRDLYYRLNVGRIHLPPLKERPEDIIPLANMFLLEFAQEKRKKFSQISEGASRILMSHNWPGNVRELKNVIEWAVFMWDDKMLRTSHLGILQGKLNTPIFEPAKTGIIDYQEFTLPDDQLPLDRYTHNIIRQALQLHNGNKSETAKYLGISRHSLYSLLKHMD